MHLTPCERFDSCIDDVSTIAANFQDRSHRETRTCVAVVLNDYFGVLFLDHSAELTEHCRLTDTSHVLQTDFGSTSFNKLVCNTSIVFCCVNRRSGDAESCLWSHSTFNGIFNRRNDVAYIIESAEDASNVGALCVLHLIHQSAHVSWNGEHAESIKTAVEHVRFDTDFIKRLCESANGFVGVLTCQKVYLFESTTIGFYTTEATHFDDDGSDAF